MALLSRNKSAVFLGYFVLLLARYTCFCDDGQESPTGSNAEGVRTYGIDVSWPMQHSSISTTREESPLSGRYEAYQKYMEGCASRYDWDTCHLNEADRIAMNLNQPAFQDNMTSAGYAKVAAPERAFQLLRKFWEDNKEHRLEKEIWDKGSIYTNHWEVGTQVLSVNRGMPNSDRRLIIEQLQDVLENWSGVPLQATSIYGVRVYQRGSILSPHVDRLPLVISAIINVAQDVEEEWPLEAIGHDGVAANLTLQPGEMILYESHSVIHGRPFPLKGEFYANVFLHFEPIGYSARLERRMREPEMSTKGLFEAALAQQDFFEKRTYSTSNELPPYIEDNSVEKVKWRQEYVYHRDDSEKKARSTKTRTKGVTNAHIAAANGKLSDLELIAKEEPEALNRADSNGWKPIHEAARSGKDKAIAFLISYGANVNERTNNGQGGTPLWWAEQMLGAGHPAIVLLRQHGAIAIPPNNA